MVQQYIVQEEVVSSAVKTYVKEENLVVEEEVVRKQGALMDFIRTQYNNLIESLNTIPKTIIGKTVESTTSVSNKLYEYADALGGKNNDKDNDTDTLMIERAHLNYIDKLRRTNIDAYKKTVAFYDSLIDQNISRPDQYALIADFVTRELAPLKIS